MPTETPIGQLFRDDFSGELQEGWVWQDEVPDRWTITQEGWLQILAEDPSLLKEGRQSNFLWRDAPVGDYVVTVHLASEVTSNFQQATLYLFKDADNYVAINRGFCSFCGGPGVYMEYRISGSSGSYNFLVAQPDLYLRLTSIGQTITGYYSLNSEDWVRAGRIGNYLPSAVIGLGATNAEPGEVNEDLVARFDYILVTLPD